MPEARTPLVTELLVEWSRGDEDALRELMPLVHAELRRIAAGYLRRERPNHTLEPTALVHEAYLRLVDQRRTSWRNRAHFFAVAAGLMRRILVDHARRRSYLKRGGGARAVTLPEIAASPNGGPDILALDEALADLEALDGRRRQIVELRFFGGLTQEEIAEALGVSVSTVERQWRLARAWLYRRLRPGEPPAGGSPEG
jgi:RNA polymerase sigma-70 factor (ECF subfamily)